MLVADAGEMAERLNAVASKAIIPCKIGSGVRIPLSPPYFVAVSEDGLISSDKFLKDTFKLSRSDGNLITKLNEKGIFFLYPFQSKVTCNNQDIAGRCRVIHVQM